MARYYPAGKATDVVVGSGTSVTIKHRDIAIFNIEGTFYAIDNACPHQGGPLCDGYIDGHAIECPWHAARFDLKTGNLLGPPAESPVGRYPVRIVDDVIEIELED